MNSNAPMLTLTRSSALQIGSDARLCRIAIERGVHSVSDRGKRWKVDWLFVAVWTALLSVVGAFWIGMFRFVMSFVR